MGVSNSHCKVQVFSFCNVKNTFFVNTNVACVNPIRLFAVFTAHAPRKILNKTMSTYLFPKISTPGVKHTQKKAKTSRITTLRAPKHFKTGRHHYQCESRSIKYVYFVNSARQWQTKLNLLGASVVAYTRLSASKFPAKPFSTINSYGAVFEVTGFWKIH